MGLPVLRTPALAAILTTILAAAPGAGQSRPPAAATDLDAFMARALERREVNLRVLRDYILSEVERFEMLGPGRAPLYRFRHEFAWYVREGTHVRSPVKFDGVAIGDAERRKYEEDWFRREGERQKKQAEERAKGQTEAGEQAPVPSSAGRGQRPIVGQVVEPRFVSEAYFLDFKFEPGNYYLVGHELLDGHDVLRIEYYPTRMFSEDEGRREGAGQRPEPQDERGGAGHRPAPRERPRREVRLGKRDAEADINRKMNRTSLVTLWIDPDEHQIVKYTFDNVWLDFLPARWLVRIDDIKASMTMEQPFEGVWLPKSILIHAGMTLANGSYEAVYTRAFSEYRQADVTSRIRVVK